MKFVYDEQLDFNEQNFIDTGIYSHFDKNGNMVVWETNQQVSTYFREENEELSTILV